MSNLKTVIAFTIKNLVNKKSFKFLSIFILLAIFIGTNAPGFIDKMNKDKDSDKILIVDSENIFNGNLTQLNDMGLEIKFEVSNDNLSMDQIKEKVNNKDVVSAIVVTKDNNDVNIKYVVQNALMVSVVPKNLELSLNTIYTETKISELNLNDKQMESIHPTITYSLETSSEKNAEGNVFTMMILSMVLFFAIYFCAYLVSGEITSEKTSKIIETLATSTNPRTIVLGKTLAIGIVALIQVLVYGTFAAICINTFMDPKLVSQILDLSKITPVLMIVTVLYFILGFLLFAFMYAFTGSTIARPEDIQSANTPVSILSLIGFYLAYFTMLNPTSSLNTFASLFPLSSPFCMPLRIMMGVSGPLDIVLSLSILAATIALVATVAIKIYENAILNYGTKMSFKDLVKMFKSKD